MSQNYYKLYTDNILLLASTIVIKSDYTAIAINNRILEISGTEPDPINKATWKYYLNISGEYHPTDEVISITSLDDLSEITFDRQTLINHPATLEAYKYGTRYYRELVTLYPNMQQFILGCIYPVDINVAINAKDGEVLTFPSYLVEEQEESLIPNIQTWIDNYKLRWYNKQFNESDNLYCSANLGIMYLNLVPLIINLRLKACLTREAHSYHIRQFLGSHGYLDKYIDHLNLKQKLFLYRNIRYIERNNGKVEIFEWLVQKLMTDRNLPLAEYSMRHDTTSLQDTYYSTPMFRRKDITEVFSERTKNKPLLTLSELLRREEPLALGNSNFTKDAFDSIQNKFKNSLSSVVNTKDLESSVIDYTDSEAYTLAEIRIGHWLKTSSNGKYNSLISFKDPITSAEKTLNAFDAFVFWFYCYCASMQISLVDIPDLLAYKILRNPKPTLNQLKLLVNSKTISDNEINALIDTSIDIPNINSIGAFSNVVKDIYWGYKRQQILLSSIQTSFKRGQMELVSDNLYVNELIDTKQIMLSRDGRNYQGFSEWFIEKGISLENYTVDMFGSLHEELFLSATGGDYFTTTELAALQKAMVGILTQLSSYSIQILTEINAKSIRKLNWSAIRPDNLVNKENSILDILAVTAHVLDTTSTAAVTYTVEPIPITLGPKIFVNSYQTGRVEIDAKIRPSGTREIRKHIIRMGPMVINHSFENPTAPGSIKHLPAYESFFDLTEPQQLTIKDVYHTVFKTDETIGKLNTALTIFKNYLPGFNNLVIIKPILTSFDFNLIPSESYNRIRLSVNKVLLGLLPNMGKMDINAYSLFISTTTVNAFKYFARQNTLNAFKYFAGPVSASASYIEDKLEFGAQLNAFTYGGDLVDVAAYSFFKDVTDISDIVYKTDRVSIDFVQDIMSRGTVQHPDNAGTVMDAFYLVAGSGQNNYTMTGFTYNGNQINWS